MLIPRDDTGTAENRGGSRCGNKSGPPIGVTTVEEVLGHNTGNLGCMVCRKKGFAVSITPVSRTLWG